VAALVVVVDVDDSCATATPNAIAQAAPANSFTNVVSFMFVLLLG
jgi:hypothetical protein